MPAFDILRPPDHVTAFCPEAVVLTAGAEGSFEATGLALRTLRTEDRLALRLHADRGISRLRLRWYDQIPEGLRYLGDASEGSGGDLEWRTLDPDRILPWYFLMYDGQHTHGVGVRTGAAALCHWQIDPYGINLWLDVRNGTAPVVPGDREVRLADVVVRMGRVWEMPFEAARRFVGILGPGRILPDQIVYGFALDLSRAGDWTRAQALQQAGLLGDLAENTVNRPVCIVGRGLPQRGGLRQDDLESDSEIGELAAGIDERGCNPGLWLHPLLTDDPALAELCLAPERPAAEGGGRVLDPTHPGALERVSATIMQARRWGYRFLRYGDMIPQLIGAAERAGGGEVVFHARHLTTAEVLSSLYEAIQKTCGSGITIAGAGTVSHLASGHVHLQRLARNLSFETWERTRSGPLGALAFRGFHHGALYAAETSPVRMDTGIPWSLNEQWLRLQAGSGLSFFVVPGRSTPSEVEQRALRQAFGSASRPLQLAEPQDWLVTTTPGRWKLGNDIVNFDWFSASYH